MGIRHIVARCIVKLLTSEGHSLTILNGETVTGVEHLQEFGLASIKPSGVEANGIVICHNGDRGNTTLLVMEIPSLKPDLSEGETALFNAYSAIVKLTSSGVAEINGGSNQGMVQVVELTDKLNAHIEEYNTFVLQFNAHSHVSAGLVDTVVSPAIPFVQGDYENTKAVH